MAETNDIAKLGLEIDHSQLGEANPKLDAFEEKSHKAADAAEKLGASATRAGEQVGRSAEGVQKLGEAARFTEAQNDRWIQQMNNQARNLGTVSEAALRAEAAQRGLTAEQQKAVDTLGNYIAGHERLAQAQQHSAEAASHSVGETVKLGGAIGVALEVVHKMFEGVSELIRAYAEWEDIQDRLSAVIEINGVKLGRSTEQVQAYIHSISQGTGESEASVTRAATSLLKFSGIVGDTFDRALKVSSDLAALMGTDITQAAETVGRALENSYGASMLRRAGLLTDAQVEYLKVLKEVSGDERYRAEVLGQLEDKVGGLAEKLAEHGLSGAWKQATVELANHTREMAEALTHFLGLENFLRGITDLLRGQRSFVEVFFPEAERRLLQSGVELLERTANALRAIRDNAPNIGLGGVTSLGTQTTRQYQPLLDLQERMEAAQRAGKPVDPLAAAANQGDVENEQAAVEVLNKLNEGRKVALELIPREQAVVQGFVEAERLATKVRDDEVQAQTKQLKAYDDGKKAVERLADAHKTLADWIKYYRNIADTNKDANAAMIRDFGSIDVAVQKLAESHTKNSKAVRDSSDAYQKLVDEVTDYDAHERIILQVDNELNRIRQSGAYRSEQDLALLRAALIERRTEIADKKLILQVDSDLNRQRQEQARAGEQYNKSLDGELDALEKLFAQLSGGKDKTDEYTLSKREAALAELEWKRAIAVTDADQSTLKLLDDQIAKLRAIIGLSKELPAARAGAAVEQAGQKDVQQLEELIRKTREHNEEIGKTKEQIDEVRAARASQREQEMQTEADAIQNLLNEGRLEGEYQTVYQKRLDYLRQAIGLQKELAGAQQEGAAAEAAAAQARDYQREFERTSRVIGDNLATAFASAFDSGKSHAEAFRESLINIFKNLILRPVVQFLVQPIAGALAGGFSGLAQGATGTGGGNIPGVNSLYNAFSGATPAAGSFGTFATSSIGQTFGLSGPAMGPPTAAGAFSVPLTGVGTAIGTALPWIGGALAIAGALGLFDKKPSKVRGQYQISGDTGGFEDNQFTESRFGNLGFRDEGTQYFSGEAAQAFNKMIAQAIDAIGTRMTAEQRTATSSRLQGLQFGGFEGEYTTQDFIQKYGGTVLKQVISGAFQELDPVLARMFDKFKGSADEAATHGNALLRIFDLAGGPLEKFNKSISVLVEQFQGGDDALIAYTSDLITLQKAISVKPGEAFEKAWKEANQTYVESLAEQRDKINELNAAWDGSADTTHELTAATLQYQQTLQSLLAQIKQIMAQVHQSIEDSIRSIRLQVLPDNKSKYNFLSEEVRSDQAELRTSNDPARIQYLANQIREDTTQAFGLLDAQEQQRRSQEYITFLQDLDKAVTDKLNEIGNKAINDATTLYNSISTKLDQVATSMTTAASTIDKAASKMNTASETMERAADTPIRIVDERGQPITTSSVEVGGQS